MNAPHIILCQLHHALADIYTIAQTARLVALEGRPTQPGGLLDTDLQELELRLNAYRPAINEASCILQAMAPAHRQLMLGVTCNATKLFDLSRANASQPELDAVLDTLDAAWNAYRAAADVAK